ncbi:MAG: agmatine deiminase family protein [Desulfuromonadaceae bacterium]|nr:agmatine deiminase family protein [Desulfuromonadaceae bacterium]
MNLRLPAEWEEQDAILMAWPHEKTDWRPRLAAARKTFADIMGHILAREKVVLIAPDLDALRRDLASFPVPRLRLILYETATDDTWTRDFGPIAAIQNGKPFLINFEFNGWGEKYPAYHDNRVTQVLHRRGLFRTPALIRPGLVLEGGSIDSDGKGALLTTERCLLNPNRNPYLSKTELEEKLAELMGIKKFLWLRHGYLAGDDTDGHVDILARFCSADTIAFSSCEDEGDEHFQELKRMAEELADFRTEDGRPYRLIPLPIPSARLDETGRRLAAGYANFLIINRAVLVPTYDDPKDAVALERLREAFPDREIIGIDCRELIRQGGSLHCATMHLPKGILG